VPPLSINLNILSPIKILYAYYFVKLINNIMARYFFVLLIGIAADENEARKTLKIE